MKTQKRSAYIVLSLTILSLSFIQGLRIKESHALSSTNAQVGVAASVVAANSSGGAQGAWLAGAGVAYGFAASAAYGAAVNSWNPAGWVGWAVAGGAAL